MHKWSLPPGARQKIARAERAKGRRIRDIRRCLASSTSVGITGIGQTLLAGPLATLVSTGLADGNTLELSAISAGLYSLGIPMSTILRHESSLQTDKVLLLTDGAATELIRAKDILRNTRPEEMHLHFGDETKVNHA